MLHCKRIFAQGQVPKPKEEKMKNWIKMCVFSMMLAMPMFAHGVLTKQSPLSFDETLEFIESMLEKNQFIIFAKIDQAKEAKKVGLSMNNGVLYIFGNPKAGTSLMQENPAWILYLPLKVAVYQDSNNATYISIFDMKKIAQRNQTSKDQMPKIEAMSNFLEKLLNVEK